MTEFAFFAGKEERWVEKMRAIWGDISICPCLDSLELPCHTLGELQSISQLKIWGNTQEPCNDMAYLLVHTEGDSEAESYGMALVWTSPHQAQVSTMEEALGTLSTCISSGPNWPYVFAQLYKGSNHTPLPKDKHIGILPWGKVEESPHGWISQLKVHQLLSAGPWVVYPVGLIGCNQSVIIDLPELLHSSSSVTTDEHPHLQINIPLPTPEEPECTTLLLGRVPGTPVDNIPKTLWKPRITLMAEVNDLINWGMADDYNHKPEHSAMGEEAAAGTDVFPPLKAEASAPPLDTSSQASVEEIETSQESNPINIYSPMATGSNCSESPMIDLTELQADTNLAANHMLSIKRSWDLERQQAIWDFEALLCQQEAKEAVANERAKIVHSRKDLNAKVKCTKAVMKAKYNYRMAIQEARTIRCNELQESEAAYLEALGENAATKSTQCTTLHGEHVKHMHDLEQQALDAENKSCQDFLFACQAMVHHTPQPLKQNLFASYHILLGQLPSSLQSIPFAKTPQAEEQPSAIASPRPELKQSPWPKRWLSSPDPQGDMSIDETSPTALQEGPSSSKRRETADWFASLKPSHADAFSHDSNPIKEARSHYFATHPWYWIHGNTDDLSNIFRELAEGANLLGKSIHKLQLSWEGPEELKHANYSLHSLPKGLKFLRVVPTWESPKIIGLKGIHNADALWHFAGYTYCPWCGKEGQNEGTMVNHLRTVHYRLGIVCNLCYSCPTVVLDTLCQHWCHNCHK